MVLVRGNLVKLLVDLVEESSFVRRRPNLGAAGGHFCRDVAQLGSRQRARSQGENIRSSIATLC
jgi:hypothetical protein